MALVDQLRAEGIRSSIVLDAIAKVPRHLFVPAESQQSAYENIPLPIGHGQTISQPYVVAYMTEALQLSPDDRVLEIGTGSGYQTAILAELAREVYSIEILPELANRARGTLSAVGYQNVQICTGDGYAGWPERAPFSRIIGTAAPPDVPQALVEQLAVGGIMVLPVGIAQQQIAIITKDQNGVSETLTIPVRFVPMVTTPP